MTAPSLVEHLHLREPACIAVIGGGGKTSVLRALANELRAAGKSSITTTTTRIWTPACGPVLISQGEAQLFRLVEAGLKLSEPLTLASHIDAAGKLIGLDPFTVCNLSAQFPQVTVLVEADGSAGRPIKAHGSHEPRIPACATVVLTVMGIWGVGKIADGTTVHRLECLSKRADAREGQCLDTDVVSRLVLSYRQLLPRSARKVLVLNGERADADESSVDNVTSRLRAQWPGLEIVRTEHGRLIASHGPGHVS